MKDFWEAELMDDEAGDWLQSTGWGGLPATGPEFMEYMSWYDMTRAEQREAVEDFMEYPRAQHMPETLRQYFIDLGLLED